MLEFIAGVTQPNSLSYTYLPCRSNSFLDSSERYGSTASYTSLSSLSSLFSSGAPASPSTQQPPLHLFRSQTNCSSTTWLLMRTLSMAIMAVKIQGYTDLKHSDTRVREIIVSLFPL